MTVPGEDPPPATGAPNRLLLDEALDLGAAAPLRAALLERKGHALAVDASGVLHLGAQCAQVLASAAATWASDGASFWVEAPSEPFRRGAELLGLRHILIPAITESDAS